MAISKEESDTTSSPVHIESKLLESGDEDGKTVLLVAAASCRSTIIEKLARLGADPHVVDQRGRNAVILAAAASCVSADDKMRTMRMLHDQLGVRRHKMERLHLMLLRFR